MVDRGDVTQRDVQCLGHTIEERTSPSICQQFIKSTNTFGGGKTKETKRRRQNGGDKKEATPYLILLDLG